MSDNNGQGHSSSAPAQIYHEKQVRQMCALHCINNVLQEGRFTKQDLDAICKELTPESSWILNPHKSMLGLGNYDVNVLTSAFNKCQKELVWFDKRLNPEQDLNLVNIFGFILNIPSNWQIGALLNFKHWFAVKQFNGDFYNLDSNLEKGPQLIGKEPELFAYLRQQRDTPGTQLFIVVNKDVAEANSWRAVVNNT